MIVRQELQLVCFTLGFVVYLAYIDFGVRKTNAILYIQPVSGQALPK